MKLNQAIVLDLKLIIAILTIVAGLGGFYYTTQLRLDSAEDNIRALETDISMTREWNNNIEKKIKNLQRRFNKLQKEK